MVDDSIAIVADGPIPIGKLHTTAHTDWVLGSNGHYTMGSSC